MKTILCFGDSLTWGAVPNGARHAFVDRWPNVLGQWLGSDKVRIIAEGLNGRTTIFDDFSGPANLNGAKTLPNILATHQPLDCIIIMLGCNDMKPHICGSAKAAARGVNRLIQIIGTFPYIASAKTPKILLVSPPVCVETNHADLKEILAGAPKESLKLSGFYQRAAKENNVAFFDAAKVANASKIDGVHLDVANTRAIGDALAPVVRDLLQI